MRHECDVRVDAEATSFVASCVVVSACEIDGPSSAARDAGSINRALSRALHAVEKTHSQYPGRHEKYWYLDASHDLNAIIEGKEIPFGHDILQELSRRDRWGMDAVLPRHDCLRLYQVGIDTAVLGSIERVHLLCTKCVDVIPSGIYDGNTRL